jgi:hypothetical protein
MWPPNSAPRSSRYATGSARCTAAAASVALFFGLLELLKASRSATFEGIWPELLPGWGTAITVYFLLLLVATALFLALMARRRPSALAAACLSGALLWVLLNTFRADAAGVAMLPAAALAGAAALLLTPRGAARARYLSGAWGAALFAGYGAMLAPLVPTPAAFRAEQAGNTYLLIVADALRADYCSTYGGPVPTPNLDRLAARGVLYESAIAPAPWTLPSMYSIAARGFHPLPANRVPSRFGGDRWLPASDAAPAVLAGNWLLGAEDGLLEAFAAERPEYLVLNSLNPEHEDPLVLAPVFREALTRLGLHRTLERPLDTSRVLLRRLCIGLGSGEWSGAYLHLMDPHDPYAPPPAFAPRGLAGRYFSPSPARDWGTKVLDARRGIDLSPLEQAEVRALYEAEIRYVDACVGKILDAVEAQGLSERMVIALTADHGEELWDHGGFYHGHTLYQEQLHVPLIVAAPQLAPGRVAGHVSLIDLMPVLEGLVQGEQAALQPGPVFAYGTVPLDHLRHEYAVIDGGFKLIEHRDGQTVELYDLSADPKEQQNLAATRPDKATEMRGLLESWKASTPLWQQDSGDDAEVLQRLETLGYL